MDWSHVCLIYFQLLVDAGADVDSLTSYNETPLWLAIWKGHSEVAKMCIQENCKLNVPSNGCQVSCKIGNEL